MTDAEAAPDAPRLAAADDDHGHVAVVESDAAFADAVAALAAGTGPVAVDAERASGFRYSQRAYLVQLFRRDAGVFLFDPTRISSFQALQDAIAGEEWVLHAAAQDLPCLRELGLDPTRLFDTELAARLLGFARVGLGSVVEELLGIHLAKEHSAADWSTRPLPQSWLVYAALDVELLVDVRDRIRELLIGADKLAIAEQEFDAVRDREIKPGREEPWRRLSGVHAVRGTRGLAIARELWNARDAYARDSDTAPGRIVPDAALVAAAQAAPASRRALADLRSFTGRESRSQLDRWWAAVQAGLETSDLPSSRGSGDSLPPPRAWADRNPEADRRLKAARPAVAAVAERMDLPVENLLTPDHLRRVAWLPPDEPDAAGIGAVLAALGARPWQVEATAQVIADAFVDAAQAVPETDEVDS